jgi:hypothetical protein
MKIIYLELNDISDYLTERTVESPKAVSLALAMGSYSVILLVRRFFKKIGRCWAGGVTGF